MGFTLWYRSSKALSATERATIKDAAIVLSQQHTWLSCEPVSFFKDTGDGHLLGGSKPNFDPDPDEVEAADAEQLPDGTIRELIDVLCQISQMYGVDWEITHDDETDWTGYIRNGKADKQMLERVAAIAELTDPPEAQPPGKKSKWSIPPLYKCLLGSGPKNLNKLKKLLEQGEDPNEDHYLEIAISDNNIEAAELLLDFGAVPRSEGELSALGHAAGWRAIPLMSRLVDLGGDVNGGSDIYTPLVLAAGNDCLESVEFLLSHGAAIDKPARQGVTALMAAAFWGHLSVVRFLLEHGADVTLRDESGRTAADFSALPWSSMGNKAPIIMGSSSTKKEKEQTAALINRTVMPEGK